MSKNRNEALLATDAFLFSFATTDTLPTGADGALPVTAVDHGIFSSDGFEQTPSRTVTNVYGSNFGLIRTISSEGSYTISGTLVQTNDENLELVTGVTKNASSGSFHWDTTKLGPVKSFVLDAIDEERAKRIRYFIKEGQVTEVSGLQVVNTGLIQYQITITAYASMYDGKMGHVVISESDYDPEVTV